MTIRYICRKCGYILLEANRRDLRKLGGLPTPQDIIHYYGGICPKCKKTLTLPSRENIKIKPRKR